MPMNYSGSFMVVKDSHPDDTYDVTVEFGDDETHIETDAFTIDTVDPIVMITAPAAGMTVKNSDTVTITVTVADGDKSSGISTVTANVVCGG